MKTKIYEIENCGKCPNLGRWNTCDLTGVRVRVPEKIINKDCPLATMSSYEHSAILLDKLCEAIFNGENVSANYSRSLKHLSKCFCINYIDVNSNDYKNKGLVK